MKRVAILGYAGSIMDAPFSDKSVEIWIPNYCEIAKAGLPRAPDRIFEIHDWETIVAENIHSVEGKNSLERMCESKIPIYLAQSNPAVPSSVTYPLDELTKEFFPWAKKVHGKWEDAYWTSSAQMMIALAIKEEFTDIGMFGIDMADSVEYRAQRKGCEYMIGFATARGINVTRPLNCPILRTKFVYGYEHVQEQAYRAWLVARKKFLGIQIANANATGNQAAFLKNQYEGHLNEVDLLEKNWLDS